MAFFEAQLEFLEESGYCFCTVPNEIALPLVNAGIRRVHCLVKGGGEFHVTLNKIQAGIYCVFISTKLRRFLKIQPGEKIQLQVIEDKSPYQFAMPESLNEVLSTDPEAASAFQRLSDGRKRSLMHWVASVKSVDKQIEKSLQIAERIKMGLSDLKEITRK